MRFVLGHKRYRRSSENHLVHVFGVEMADKVTRIISRLRTLELTDDESVILGAFVAFTTGEHKNSFIFNEFSYI